MSLTDEIWSDGPVNVAALSVGDEFFVRYVPQSRFFQSQELDLTSRRLTQQQIQTLNNGQRVTIRQIFDPRAGKFVGESG